ncbi:S8 family serine peptidase, partial [Ruminiclostridium cellobioparum]
MLKKMKCLSVFLVLLFMLQSILMPAVYATEAKDVVMEISEQQLTLTNFGNTSNSVELVWTSIGNSINAMSYDIYRNDSLIKTTESFAYTDTELTPDTEYKYMVRAKDLDGNVIAESNSINVITALNDSIADEVSIIATSSAIALEPSKSEELVKENPDFETDRFIIKYKNQNSMMRAREAFTKIDKIDNSSKNSMNNKKNSKDMDFDIIMLNKKEKLRDIVADLQKNDLENDIEYIQPDYQLSLSSNDPYYSSQWGLENNFKEVDSSNNTSIKNNLKKLPLHLRDAIDKNLEFKEFLINTPSEELRQKLMARDVPGNVEPYILMELVNEPVIMDLRDMTDTAPIQPAYLCDAGVTEAWSISTGSGITVAVIDTGVDIAHEDLAENIWVNTEEISGNGIDDDGNGKIDDTNGWNFSEDNNVVFDIENITEENHGTHIAGIIAAVKDNGKGIAGVAPSAKVMPLKVFNNGKAYTSDIINAIQYAENMGAKIVNCSWGSNDENTALKEVIQASNMLFVCAAGNSGADIDSNPVYPAAFDCSNIITVASVNKNGSLSSFSNYGEGSVDVAAPGEGIKSTLSGNAYGQNSGSSMSAAFTSGEAALLLSNLANMSTMELKDRIVQCSEHLSSLTGKISGSVKINCVNAVKDIKNDEIINVSDTAITQSSSPLTENTDDFSLFSTSAVEAQFVKIAGGNHHSLALDSNGDVWACGLNNYGELGDGTKTTRATPVKVGGLSKITAIACGSSHSMALKNDGTVWAWGNNYYGQLGDGTTTTKTTAVQVSGLSEITAIAGG